MDLYIKYINEDWNKLKQLPQPNFKDINCIDNVNSRILLMGFYNLFDEIFRTYKVDAIKNAHNTRNNNLLSLACYMKYMDAMKKLEDIGMKYDNDMYLFACYHGNVDIMEYLERKGCDIKFTDKCGNNAYLYASIGGNVNVMEILEKKGFDINFTNKFGANAYLLASQKKNINVMEHLEDKDYNINVTDKFGNSALTLALQQKNNEVIEHIEKKIVTNKKIVNCKKINIKPAEVGEQACITCGQNLKNFIIVPCGHLCFCSLCANAYESGNCPICRQKVEYICKVYT